MWVSPAASLIPADARAGLAAAGLPALALAPAGERPLGCLDAGLPLESMPLLLSPFGKLNWSPLKLLRSLGVASPPTAAAPLLAAPGAGLGDRGLACAVAAPAAPDIANPPSATSAVLASAALRSWASKAAATSGGSVISRFLGLAARMAVFSFLLTEETESRRVEDAVPHCVPSGILQPWPLNVRMSPLKKHAASSWQR
mmetsp:Transcript_37687/g.117202  ORF Transcript_37687/g.117202 Transcript_37687/m.117202 type:complete len:200 (-) Transcript_37687:844-1443(-)